MINKMKGQTALILILLTAAALIFFAITLNWGRIAQVKGLLTVAADESASLLTSDAASYGEEQKQTYLNDTNFKSSQDGVLLNLIILIVAILICVIPSPLQPAAGWALGLAIAGMTMTFVTMVLQLAWINPLISSLWNGLQKNQPIQQQFYEQGIGAALQGTVTDQVNITDYFDSNANGNFGITDNLANDTVGRFAFYYSDRLKMLNQPDIPQVVFFYNQLGELMNGETCAQNAIDNCLSQGNIPISSQCKSPQGPGDCTVSLACSDTSTDALCEQKMPNSFQLNDACVDSGVGSPAYNPYCDPCCQLLNAPNTNSSNANATISLRPANCDPGTMYNGAPLQCLTNNPYGSTTSNYTNTLLYDQTFQEYSNNISFLDQFGRDQQTQPVAAGTPPVDVMSPDVMSSSLEFPNGVYPFFWLMKDYSPQVDNIDSRSIKPAQEHWCTTASGYTAPSGFSDLQQLVLPYACTGQDCCVNYLADNPNSSTSDSNTIPVAVGTAPTPSVVINSPLPGAAYNPGDPVDISITASEAAPGSIKDVQVMINNNLFVDATQPSSGDTYQYTYTIPATAAGTYSLQAIATDVYGVTATQTVSVTVEAPPSTGTDTGTGTSTGTNTSTGSGTGTDTDTGTGTNTGTSASNSTTGANVIRIAQVSMTNATNGTSSGPCTDGAPATPAATTPPALTCGTNAALNKYGGYPAGTTITMTAATNATGVTAMAFYYSNSSSPSTEVSLGTVLSGNASGGVYTYVWNNVPQGTYNLSAEAISGGAVSSSSGNGVIDAVGTAFASNPGANPALSPKFAEGPYSNSPPSSLMTTLMTSLQQPQSWQEGDNQMCSMPTSTPEYGWPYNGSSGSYPDGSCEWTGTVTTSAPPANGSLIGALPFFGRGTVDAMDDTMHTLSDFTIFANNFLGQSIDALSANLDTWYPQAALWIAPSDNSPACSAVSNGSSNVCNGSDQCPDNSNPPNYNQTCPSSGVCPNDGTTCTSLDGRLLSIYNPYTGVDKLSDWNAVITNWLNNTYTSSSTGAVPWCVPPALPSGTDEYSYINKYSGTKTWGDLPHVIACLNYNANTQADPVYGSSVVNYQNCLQALTMGTCSALPSVCGSQYLGRTLLSSAIEPMPITSTRPFNPQIDCNINDAGSYAKWVNDSLTLANDEAPKFTLRSAFLTDIYNRATAMQKLFVQGDAELHKFLLPCSGANCSGGGPAAQLMYARSQASTTATLPNSVIYGWVDRVTNTTNQSGYAHIVKITAYAPGRAGAASFIAATLPFIRTTTHLFTRDYELRSRDGYVYVSVKRWDQDHSNTTNFPNGHPLWQFMFHNPAAAGSSTSLTSGLPEACIGLNANSIGFGLEPGTVNGLNYVKYSKSPADTWAFQNAFMLNDNGNGQVDPINCPKGNCPVSNTCAAGGGNSDYCSCLSQANQLLANAPESHACMEYVASTNVSTASGQGDKDYSLKFVDCSSVPGIPSNLSALDDMSYEGS